MSLNDLLKSTYQDLLNKILVFLYMAVFLVYLNRSHFCTLNKVNKNEYFN